MLNENAKLEEVLADKSRAKTKRDFQVVTQLGIRRKNNFGKWQMMKSAIPCPNGQPKFRNSRRETSSRVPVTR
jgi:hypothetical protein